MTHATPATAPTIASPLEDLLELRDGNIVGTLPVDPFVGPDDALVDASMDFDGGRALDTSYSFGGTPNLLLPFTIGAHIAAEIGVWIGDTVASAYVRNARVFGRPIFHGSTADRFLAGPRVPITDDTSPAHLIDANRVANLITDHYLRLRKEQRSRPLTAAQGRMLGEAASCTRVKIEGNAGATLDCLYAADYVRDDTGAPRGPDPRGVALTLTRAGRAALERFLGTAAGRAYTDKTWAALEEDRAAAVRFDRAWDTVTANPRWHGADNARAARRRDLGMARSAFGGIVDRWTKDPEGFDVVTLDESYGRLSALLEDVVRAERTAGNVWRELWVAEGEGFVPAMPRPQY